MHVHQLYILINNLKIYYKKNNLYSVFFFYIKKGFGGANYILFKLNKRLMSDCEDKKQKGRREKKKKNNGPYLAMHDT